MAALVFIEIFTVFFIATVNGFYVQPDVTFLIEQPESQLVLIGSSFSLSCGVELRGLSNEEGGLNVPVVHWLFNHTTITDIFPEAVDVEELINDKYLRSTLYVPRAMQEHTGTYSCNVVDGTNEGPNKRKYQYADLCVVHNCVSFTTSSYPATITIIGNVMVEAEVEFERFSSVLLLCGSLLPTQRDLRPHLQWMWNNTALNQSSNWYEVLTNGDLVLYESDDGTHLSEVDALYQCIAHSGSNNISSTLASYTLTEVSGSGVNERIQLSIASPSPLVEGDSFSIYLTLSGVCQENSSLACQLWTRNDSSLCSNDSDGIINDTLHPSQDLTYECGDRALRFNEASQERDSGRYCCQYYDEYSTCIDITVQPAARPVIISSHNDSTISMSHPSPLTLTCTTPSHPTNTSISWLFNSVLQPELHDLEEITINVTNNSTGVYQCLASNTFGYAVANLRIVPQGLTNPPGIPQYIREAPWPDEQNRPAYLFSWQAPSYPELLDADRFKYSTILPESTFIYDNSVVAFIPRYSYVALAVGIVDIASGEKQSELSPVFFGYFDSSVCSTQVYFPPVLTANCAAGETNLTWTNNPHNELYYASDFYAKYGPIPGLYYINVTCSTPNNTVLKLGEVATEEGSIVFRDLEWLTIGSECVFRGAATPLTSDDPFCVDPANILFNSTNCSTTGYIEFENGSYVAREDEGGIGICVATKGVGYTFQLAATYEDNNTSKVWTVEVVSGSRQCVLVELEDDEVVNEERSITLELMSDDARVSTGPSTTLRILNDDVAEIYFTKPSYVVEEGSAISVCIAADRELQISVHIFLSTEEDASVRLDAPDNFTLGPHNTTSCLSISSRDDGNVDRGHTYQLILTPSNEHHVVVTTNKTTLTIQNDDVIQVGFTKSAYQVDAGEQLDICVRAITSGYLEKRISIDLTLSDGGVGVVDVELDWTTIEFDSGNSTRCVLLNTSSSGSTAAAVSSMTQLLELSLDSEDRDVQFLHRVVYITVQLPLQPVTTSSFPPSPTLLPTIFSTTEENSTTKVVLISVINTVLLFGVLSLIACIVLFLTYRHRTGYYKTPLNLPEGPLEDRDYVPRVIAYGSLSTVYDGVVEPSNHNIINLTELEKDTERDATSGISSLQSVAKFPSTREEVVEERERDRDRGGGGELQSVEDGRHKLKSSPVEEQLTVSSPDNEQESPCQSGSSISQHQYIASDSIIGLVGGHYDRTQYSVKDLSENTLSEGHNFDLSEVSTGRDKDSGIDVNNHSHA